MARVALTAKNLLEVARFGGLRTGEQPAPYEIVDSDTVARLRHYVPPSVPDTLPPLLLVPPLMLTADIWDVSPQASAVRSLMAEGLDPWVIDFGSPEQEEGGLERTMSDHILAISKAVDTIREATGSDVHLGGYSQGGMFAYQVAAYRRSAGLASLITFGSPVDMRSAMPLGLSEDFGVRLAELVVGGIFGGRAMPGWFTRNGFRLLDPIGSVKQRVEFLLQLHDRQSLLPREGQRRYLMSEGWVAWPGPALAEFVDQFLVHRRMLEGGLVVDDRPITLADITSPVLSFVGESDDIAPPPSVRALRRAAPRADVYEKSVAAGHFGLVVGRSAAQHSWPAVAEWVRWRAGVAELPADIIRVPDGEIELGRSDGPLAGASAALEVATEATGLVAARVSRAARTARGVATSAAVELPRLARMSRTRQSARISLALMLDEQAARQPEGHLFLFGDRAYTHAQVKYFVDAMAEGLHARGVRPGERVGVLMGVRPTALAVIAALNRIGAVAAMLRPDGDLSEEARLAAIGRILADPENRDRAQAVRPTHTVLLDGTSMTIEPTLGEATEMSPSFTVNPGRAHQVAFILFTGRPGHAQPQPITNGRWALSALGTASAASLRPSDTLYSLNPPHHPAGLLTGVGGAIAAGSRIAMAGADPFWDEVRRYGVTVVSYTWAQLREVADGPTTRAELHNAVRLFLGSGMPLGVWRRLQQRFPASRVLEFWVAADGGGLLANVGGTKLGSQGRPLPGSAQVELARYDLTAGAIEEGPNGRAIVCRPGEVGMLLVRGEGGPDGPRLTDVFARGDAWIETQSLFRRDVDGDYWFLGTLNTAVQTPLGLVPTVAITAALETIRAVDLAVTYAGADGTLVSTLAPRPGQSVSAADIDDALAQLAPPHRPAKVYTASAVPLNAWGRPVAPPRRGRQIWPKR